MPDHKPRWKASDRAPLQATPAYEFVLYAEGARLFTPPHGADLTPDDLRRLAHDAMLHAADIEELQRGTQQMMATAPL